MSILLHEGDCLDVLQTMPNDSVDSVITDPPGGISFMGKVWDSDKGGRDQWITWMTQISAECLRVIKPGGHALVWALPRTSHWTATAWENAGWEVRDRVAHLFGNGFPKSANHLKPACEDWWLLRKPLIGSVADNVAVHGTGAINIDDCRVPGQVHSAAGALQGYHGSLSGLYKQGSGRGGLHDGRWPANVIHDGSDEVLEAFAAFGEIKSVAGTYKRSGKTTTGRYGAFSGQDEPIPIRYGDNGTASRFFYCAKASKAERNGSKHPTVKPVSLMRYLCKLVTPPNGVVLDPFAGTGSTGQAAVDEGFNAVLIEQEPEYCMTIRCRLALWLTPMPDPAARNLQSPSLPSPDASQDNLPEISLLPHDSDH